MILVAGAGGFIGGHIVEQLLEEGHDVRAVDVKPRPEWFQYHPAAENRELDLRMAIDCRAAVQGASEVINLAADMGGMGFIETHKAECMLSVLINTHLIRASALADVERYTFASSACVYASGHQTQANLLEEADAYPAAAEDGYGWEKLFSERMCRHFREDYGLETRIPRLHNVYGIHGTWDGGREKAPAAICRKVAQAIIDGTGEIEIWGDGKQVRSFMDIRDCVEGLLMIHRGSYVDPINLGSEEMVSIDELVSLVEEIAGATILRRDYDLSAPQGVRGRGSDNRLIREVYDWEPSRKLAEGLEVLYPWIYDQIRRRVPA